jgi:hypothetical protein
MRPQQGFLHHVFGGVDVAGQADGEPLCRGHALQHEPVKCCPVHHPAHAGTRSTGHTPGCARTPGCAVRLPAAAKW